MKRILSGVVLLTCGIPLLTAAGRPAGTSKTPLPSTASGTGTITFGSNGHGVGFFVFDVTRGSPTTGSLVFAGEDQHGYPDIVVRVSRIDHAVFGPRSVKFSGKGTLHDESVSVTATASDGAGTQKPDRFGITCTNEKGRVVFEAKGDLSIGDVVIGEPS